MKRVFLTGASSGIGLATAKLLAGRGDEVWGTSRDINRIPQLPRLHAVRLDLADNVSLGESFRLGYERPVILTSSSTPAAAFQPAEHLTEAMVAQFRCSSHIELCRLAPGLMQFTGADGSSSPPWLRDCPCLYGCA